MKAKENRDDLSFWDVRKPPLYGRALASVQAQLFKMQSVVDRKRLICNGSGAILICELQESWAGLSPAVDFGLAKPTSTKTG
jgi:hypothetical protein